MSNNNGKGREIFYGVIGVSTLVVAIIGATFAYFTATVSNTTNITGNMASISLALDVTKVTHTDEGANGLIPMSNGMIEAAVSKKGTNERGTKSVCVDDNGNTVCQIYKITLTNNSTAAVFVDGYTALKNSTVGNAGAPTDIGATAANISLTNPATTMRWVQVFTNDDGATFTTALTANGDAGNDYNLGGDDAITWASLDPANKESQAGAWNTANIKNAYDDVVSKASEVDGGVTINGNQYDNIDTNYIRISDHAWSAEASTKEVFNRQTDITSALVYNQRIAPAVSPTQGTSVDYYIAVWLTETGTNQNATAEAQDTNKNAVTTNFFTGNVTFISASGSEVSGTFQGLTAYQQ